MWVRPRRKFFVKRDGRSKGGRCRRNLRKIRRLTVSDSRGRHRQCRSGAGRYRRFDWIIHCASSRGGDAGDYRRVYLEGASNLLRCFFEARFFLRAARVCTRRQTVHGLTRSSLAEPTRETGKILRETEEIVLRAGGTVARVAGIYGPDRSFLLRKFLAGEAVDRPRARSFPQSSSSRRHRFGDVAADSVWRERDFQRRRRPAHVGQRMLRLACPRTSSPAPSARNDGDASEARRQ